MRPAAALLVIAKCPRSRPVKTRLAERVGAEAATAVAAAMLADTLDAVAATPCRRRVVVLEGDEAASVGPGGWLGGEFEVLAQRGGGLADRIANAFDDLAGPGFLIGSDTPQVTPALLGRALDASRGDHDVAIGPAEDGGYWGIGMAAPRRRCFEGVPMSTAATYAATLDAIRSVGARPVVLEGLVDVDDLASLRTVAAQCDPRSRTAAVVEQLALVERA